jgi:hypothetical protein
MIDERFRRFTFLSMQFKERSLLARIARWKLGNKARVAMVIGRTVHLSGVTRHEFLADAEWVAHEAVHLRQFQTFGFWGFLARYLWESARVGYYANKYEVEAREEAARAVGQRV